MAEDLSQPLDENMTLEEIDDEYFDDLISRSFFSAPIIELLDAL